jgi:hypothetical protein
MQFLWALLIKLLDMACWLCTKRDGATERQGLERALKPNGRADKVEEWHFQRWKGGDLKKK